MIDRRTLGRRLLAWSIALAIMSAVFLKAVLPLFALRSGLAADLDHKVGLIEGYERRVSRAKADSENDRKAIEAVLASGLFLRESDGSRAGAELREYLDLSVATSGAKVQSSQGFGASTGPGGGISSVSLQVIMTADLTQFYDTLYELESQRPYLFVDEVIVDAERRTGRGKDVPLRIRLRLTGYAASNTLP